MNETHAAATAVLAATPDCLEAILRSLPRVTLERAADGDWSPKDVAAHLLISEDQGAIGRIRAIAGSNDAHLPSYDEQAELERSEWRSADLGALLAEFRMRREADVAWLTALGEGELSRTGRHAEVGSVTARELLFHVAYHDCLHLRQLLAMLQGSFEPLRGAMRVY